MEFTDDADYLRGNRLLAALPAEEFEHLRPHFETVTLEIKDYLDPTIGCTTFCAGSRRRRWCSPPSRVRATGYTL